MQGLLDSPGMIAAFGVILVLEVLSLLLLAVNIAVYRNQSEKYRALLSRLGGQENWGKPGRILVPLYILLTLGITVVTMLLFLFQPHLL